MLVLLCVTKSHTRWLYDR